MRVCVVALRIAAEVFERDCVFAVERAACHFVFAVCKVKNLAVHNACVVDCDGDVAFCNVQGRFCIACKSVVGAIESAENLVFALIVALLVFCRNCENFVNRIACRQALCRHDIESGDKVFAVGDSSICNAHGESCRRHAQLAGLNPNSKVCVVFHACRDVIIAHGIAESVLASERDVKRVAIGVARRGVCLLVEREVLSVHGGLIACDNRDCRLVDDNVKRAFNAFVVFLCDLEHHFVRACIADCRELNVPRLAVKRVLHFKAGCHPHSRFFCVSVIVESERLGQLIGDLSLFDDKTCLVSRRKVVAFHVIAVRICERVFRFLRFARVRCRVTVVGGQFEGQFVSVQKPRCDALVIRFGQGFAVESRFFDNIRQRERLLGDGYGCADCACSCNAANNRVVACRKSVHRHEIVAHG